MADEKFIDYMGGRDVRKLKWRFLKLTEEAKYSHPFGGSCNYIIVAEDSDLLITVIEHLPNYLAEHIVMAHNASLASGEP